MEQINDNLTLVCYCFGYTTQDIISDIAANGRSTIMDRIVAEKRSNTCRCTQKNPKGR